MSIDSEPLASNSHHDDPRSNLLIEYRAAHPQIGWDLADPNNSWQQFVLQGVSR